MQNKKSPSKDGKHMSRTAFHQLWLIGDYAAEAGFILGETP